MSKPANEQLSIIAADDHVLFLEGLASLLEHYARFTLQATCSDRDELLELVAYHQPDIILLDVSMPGRSIADVMQELCRDFPHVSVIALTMCAEPSYAKSLIELGLHGYVLKDAAFDDLETAMLAVAAGDSFISPKLMAELETCDSTHITARERMIIELLAQGLCNQSIAETLSISERTVRFHISNCMLKLSAKGRSHLVAIALKKSIIQLSSV